MTHLAARFLGCQTCQHPVLGAGTNDGSRQRHNAVGRGDGSGSGRNSGEDGGNSGGASSNYSLMSTRVLLINT